jgi:hypothetical protein
MECFPWGDGAESSVGKKSGEGGAEWCVSLRSTWGFNTVASVPKGMGCMNGRIMTGKIAEIEKPAREPVLIAWGRVA